MRGKLMSEHIRLIAQGMNVAPIYWALQSHPELWNQHTARTDDPTSPHYGLDDIWPRYGDPERAKDGQPHDAYWYPSADILGIKPMCLDLMRAVEAVELGGILITRIPPGKEVKPHIDPGWHAQRYEKYAIQITSSPGQSFCFEDGQLETKPGDVYWFDNSFSHWVTNPTPYERVTMIVCVRKGV